MSGPTGSSAAGSTGPERSAKDPGGGSTDVSVVLTTAPSQEVAELIGRTVVAERLAACANVVGGVTSIFRWKGSVERESETLVILKTTTAEVEALRMRVVELHPYEVPEVIALEVGAGHAPYLEWVRDSVREAP